MSAEIPLCMFVTVPAGAGKSTAINVEQQFCFEFSRAVGMQSKNKTCHFTAITGCAAALFDGVTLHKAVYLNTPAKNITRKMVETWRHVKKQTNKLSKRLLLSLGSGNFMIANTTMAKGQST